MPPCAPWWSNWPKVDRPVSPSRVPGIGVARPTLRYLKEVFARFRIAATLADYSETLDGPQLDDTRRSPPVHSVESVRAMDARASASNWAAPWPRPARAAAFLESRFGVARAKLGWPVGVPRKRSLLRPTLSELSGRPNPPETRPGTRPDCGFLRGPLISMIFGRPPRLYTRRTTLVVGGGLTAFLAEIGSRAGAVSIRRREAAVWRRP